MTTHLISTPKIARSRATVIRAPSCILATLILHSLALQPLMLGTHESKRPPPEESGAGASSHLSDEASYMTLVMVSMPSTNESPDTEDFSSLGVAQSDLQIQIASPDPAPFLQADQFEQDEEVDVNAAQTAGDPAVQSLLFGRYTSQLDARIGRAWRKPRSPIAPPTKDSQGHVHHKDVFDCQARISQDERGNVTEVELLQCEGSTEWQMSLVRAIQSASPLPAPPSPTVFTSVLTMSFEGRAYIPGYREDEYEPADTELAQARFSR